MMLDRRTALGWLLATSALSLPACRTIAQISEADWLSDPWGRAERIVAAIRRVAIPQRIFALADFAPNADDARPAILAAISAAHDAGGGRVVIPAGLHLSGGPIRLRSNVELHLEAGAILRFLPGEALYLPPVRTRWEGTECYTLSPMLYAEDCENIALTGSGTIDGQGAAHWLPWRATQKAVQDLLRDMGRDGVSVEQRVFIGERRLRPHFVQFNRCKRVLIDGPMLVDSPFWMVHPLFCEDVVIRNIRCKSDHVNSDGIDPDSSRRVLIENCDFDVGDDGISLKSGRDQDGWRVGIPTQDVVIRNCTYSGHAGGGMAIGSEMSGGVSNVFVDSFRIPKARHTLYFKANLDRGGRISNIFIRNITAGETASLLVFTNDYHSYRGGNFPTVFERILVENVTVAATDTGISIAGHPDAPVRDVVIRDVAMGAATDPLRISNASGTTLYRVTHGMQMITLGDAKPVPPNVPGGF